MSDGDGDHPAGESSHDRAETGLEHLGRLGVAWPEALDALAHFAERHDAHRHVLVARRLEPASARRPVRGSPQLTRGGRVEEEPHRSSVISLGMSRRCLGDDLLEDLQEAVIHRLAEGTEGVLDRSAAEGAVVLAPRERRRDLPSVARDTCGPSVLAASTRLLNLCFASCTGQAHRAPPFCPDWTEWCQMTTQGGRATPAPRPRPSPVISRAPRPRVMKLPVQRMSTRNRFWRPTR